MSLYNLMHGVNPFSGILLSTLGLTPDDVGRFRDVSIQEKGGKLRISVYTRNGGGNRDDYQEVFDELEKHPNYLCDFDDSFDCTYATIEFSIPEKHLDLVSHIHGMTEDKRSPKEKMGDLLTKLQTGDKNDPEIRTFMEKMKPVADQIKQAIEGSESKVIEV